MTDVVDTRGYIDPGCVAIRKASKESDVHSFGIVALELACERKPVDQEALEDQVVMLDWVRVLHERGEVLEAVDQRLRGHFDELQMKCLLNIGLWCAHFEQGCRPSIKEAIKVLNFKVSIPLLQLDTTCSSHRTPTVNETTSLPSTSNSAIYSRG